MNDHEADACRRMWRAVAALALRDDNVRIAAARAGLRSRAISGGYTSAIRTADGEIRVAREYYRGAEWRWICEQAGIDGDPAKAMAFVTGGPKAVHCARIKVMEADLSAMTSKRSTQDTGGAQGGRLWQFPHADSRAATSPCERPPSASGDVVEGYRA